MNLPSYLYTQRWLLFDTFRLATSSGLVWVMLAVTLICTVFCLSIGFDRDVPLQDGREPVEFLGPEARERITDADPEFLERRTGVVTVTGKMTVGFGALEVDLTRDRSNAIRYVQTLLAGWVADTAGILLLLIWTAGFLPSFLEPTSAAVLLAKPTPRWVLLVGKYLSVIVFVALGTTLFIGLTWFALALVSGVWDPTYLLCIPILVLHFAALFGFSVFLAVCTRNTGACVIGSILFWVMCCGLNYGRHAFHLEPKLSEQAGATSVLVEAGYWIMPKPIDMGLILFDALQAGAIVPARAFDPERLQHEGLLIPELSILSSLLFAGAMLLVSALQFRKTDY